MSIAVSGFSSAVQASMAQIRKQAGLGGGKNDGDSDGGGTGGFKIPGMGMVPGAGALTGLLGGVGKSDNDGDDQAGAGSPGIAGSPGADTIASFQAKLFNAADANGDGQVSKDELSNMISKGRNHKGIDANSVFAKMDANKDGAIGKDEFNSVLSEMMKNQRGGGSLSQSHVQLSIAKYQMANDLLSQSGSSGASTNLDNTVGTANTSTGSLLSNTWA